MTYGLDTGLAHSLHYYRKGPNGGDSRPGRPLHRPERKRAFQDLKSLASLFRPQLRGTRHALSIQRILYQGENGGQTGRPGLLESWQLAEGKALPPVSTIFKLYLYLACEVFTMSTATLPRSSSPAPARRRIADVVHRSLKIAVRRQCTQRYDRDMTLRRLDRAAASELLHLQIECRDLIQLDVVVTASHVGGNVYDVGCKIEDGPSSRATYALPAGGGTALSWAPGLGQKLAHFLLDELERELGRRALSTDGSPCSS